MLIVAKSLGGSGSETAMIEFINHLSSKKYDLSLLLDKDDEYKYRLNKKAKLNYIQFDTNSQELVARRTCQVWLFLTKLNLPRTVNK